MSQLHKEKERLRHQKQVKLLNEVMEYVPQVSSESQSKVRKLRHLVLYSHYLQIIHSKLTEGLCTDTTFDENCVKGAVTKLTSKPMKVLHQPKRKTRAHIVFLHADKSANCKNNVLKNHVTQYNDHEVHSGNQKSASVLPSDYEYKVPDVVSLDNKINMFINQEDTSTPEDSGSLQHIKDHSISSNNCTVSSKFIIHNNEKTCNDLDLKLASKDFYCKEKEHFLPFVADSKAFNVKEFEEYSMYDDKFAQSVVISDESLRTSKHKLNNFHTYLTNDYDNHVLENFEFSNVRNKNFKIPHLSSSDKGKEYLLNSSESDTVQNFNTSYGLPSSTTKYLQTSKSYYDGWHNSDFSLNSECRQPIYCDQVSVIENTSNYSISSSSTSRTTVDIDNLSDSNTSYNNLSDSSNSTQYNSYNSYINSTCNTLNKVPKFEPKEVESDVFHLFPPNFSYIGNNGVLMNEALIGQMYNTNLPQFSGVYPSRINFSGSSNCSAAFQPDSINYFGNGIGELENYKDFEFLCSPSLYNSIHSEQLSVPSPKPAETHFNNPPGFFSTESIKPPFFEEEISYSLTHYLNNS